MARPRAVRDYQRGLERKNLMMEKLRFNRINILLLTIILLIVGGRAFAQSEIKVRKPGDADTLFEKVYQSLTAKPPWLFEEWVCPLEVFPATEAKLNYSIVNCAENSATCLNNCKNKDGNSCYALALLIQNKKGLDQDNSEALFLRACNTPPQKMFKKTSKKHDPWGCTMFGLALSTGRGVAKNTEKALEVLAKPCKYKEEHESCKAARNLTEEIKKSQPKN
jgi:TPR repeat protein